ncbi:MAG TPA: sigma-70 family RNA polymerase sigma factor [Polyangia bacterium]
MLPSAKERIRAEVASDRTRTLMVRVARRVLPNDECEDAAHDAVVQALVSAGRFRAEAQVGTWLHRIAFNAALMKQRSAQRSHRRLQRVEREANTCPELVSVPRGSGRAIDELEEEELRGQLRAAVQQLPEVYRTVVERCVFDEQNAETVAADLGITPSALRTRITRARERLREVLAERTSLAAAA